MKSLSPVSPAVLLVLAVVSLSCGSGNPLVSIAVSPNPASLNAPQTVKLKAVGTFRNGTTEVLSSATWTLSSPVPWITLDHSGLVTCSVSGGPVYGNATATASLAGVSGSAQLLCSGPGV